MKVCPHASGCGGCSRQGVSYEKQLADKETLVRTVLSDLPVESFSPVIPSPEIYYYRNKMEYSFGDLKDLAIIERPRMTREQARKLGSPVIERENVTHLGLHPRGRFAVVTPTPECQLLSEEAMRIVDVVCRWANDHQISVYTRKSGEGNLRHLVIREGKNTNERLVNLVAKSTTSHVDDLAERLRTSGISVTTFLWTTHDGLSDVARGQAEKIYWGAGTIEEHLGQMRLRVAPNSFMQTNTHAAERMIDVLRAWLAADMGDEPRKVIDLYCGSGAIGLNLARANDELVGIEVNPAAVEGAVATAKANGRTRARFFAGNVDSMILTEEAVRPSERTVMVVDPPRAGLAPQVVQTLLEWAVPHLYYVSCNPATLARDLRGLSERYSILDVQPMDFFPHTDHIESAVRLKLK
jgi:23S rRNA (uracil-5-)-methyltransferase RumA